MKYSKKFRKERKKDIFKNERKLKFRKKKKASKNYINQSIPSTN